MIIRYTRDEAAFPPVKAYETDLGYDLRAMASIALPPGKVTAVDLGLRLAIPKGYGGLIRDRSSVAQRGVIVVGGVLDAGYRGTVIVLLLNTTQWSFDVKRGDKVAQLLILPVLTVQWKVAGHLDHTARDTKGFGSSGE